jgi:excisionase family DNA binding protein
MEKETPQTEWVSLREAADILGVHPATIRNWADKGDLPMRRTPGGHRRFRRGDLNQWLETRQAPPPAEVQMLIQNALGRMRLHISEGSMSKLDWYAIMPASARGVMAQKGRNMLEALQGYLVDGLEAPKDDAICQMGRDYGRFLIGQGLSLRQAMQGFLVFSDFLQEAALNIIEVVNMRPPTEWIVMLRHVRQFNNHLLLGIAEVYEQQEPGTGQ